MKAGSFCATGILLLIALGSASDATKHQGLVKNAISDDKLKLLEQWHSLLQSSLKEMAKAQRTTNYGACSAVQGGSTTSYVVIHQDVQRFGRYGQLRVDGKDLPKIQEGLTQTLAAERLELGQKARQLKQMIDFLQGQDGAERFTDTEVHDQVMRAERVVGGDKSLAKVEVRLHSGQGTPNCTQSMLVKPLMMYANTLLAEPSILSEDGLEPRVNGVDLARLLAMPTALYVDSFTAANDRWAAEHKLVTYVWLYVLNVWAFMVPSFGSGPFMPEASGGSCFVDSLPWSHMFGPHVSCASPLGIVTETQNPGASFWFRSCQYGLLTFSPPGMARSSCWMIPGIGQLYGQIIPGRMMPDRTVLGSHPCGCSNLYGKPDIESTSETYLAPRHQGYDQQLVELLYQAAERNASFSRVTFFTTSLTQLAVLGYYPKNTALQHHGVQFTLRSDSPDMPFLQQMKGEDLTGARVVTVEMMANGLLWTLRSSELQPHDVHSTETYEFDHVGAEAVADYILDQRGTTYHDANCQLYARNLMERIMTHGQGLKGVDPVLGTRDETTYRLVVVCLALVLLLAASALAQWALVWRVVVHLRYSPPDECHKVSLMARMHHTWWALKQDAAAFEVFMAAKCGLRVAGAMRYMAIFVGVSLSSPFFWYMVITGAQSFRRKKVVVATASAPLLAGSQ
jgi:hypothetical protein